MFERFVCVSIKNVVCNPPSYLCSYTHVSVCIHLVRWQFVSEMHRQFVSFQLASGVYPGLLVSQFNILIMLLQMFEAYVCRLSKENLPMLTW